MRRFFREQVHRERKKGAPTRRSEAGGLCPRRPGYARAPAFTVRAVELRAMGCEAIHGRNERREQVVARRPAGGQLHRPTEPQKRVPGRSTGRQRASRRRALQGNEEVAARSGGQSGSAPPRGPSAASPDGAAFEAQRSKLTFAERRCRVGIAARKRSTQTAPADNARITSILHVRLQATFAVPHKIEGLPWRKNARTCRAKLGRAQSMIMCGL